MFCSCPSLYLYAVYDLYIGDACEGTDWDFHMYDSFGDGWNGNVATVSDCDGNVLVSDVTLDGGSSGEADICLDHDPTTGFHIVVDGGTWQSEVSWNLLDENGEVQLSGGAPYDGFIGCPGSSHAFDCR